MKGYVNAVPILLAAAFASAPMHADAQFGIGASSEMGSPNDGDHYYWHEPVTVKTSVNTCFGTQILILRRRTLGGLCGLKMTEQLTIRIPPRTRQSRRTRSVFGFAWQITADTASTSGRRSHHLPLKHSTIRLTRLELCGSGNSLAPPILPRGRLYDPTRRLMLRRPKIDWEVDNVPSIPTVWNSDCISRSHDVCYSSFTE